MQHVVKLPILHCNLQAMSSSGSDNGPYISPRPSKQPVRLTEGWDKLSESDVEGPPQRHNHNHHGTEPSTPEKKPEPLGQEQEHAPSGSPEPEPESSTPEKPMRQEQEHTLTGSPNSAPFFSDSDNDHGSISPTGSDLIDILEKERRLAKREAAARTKEAAVRSKEAAMWKRYAVVAGGAWVCSVGAVGLAVWGGWVVVGVGGGRSA
ncbi:hypothetical protein LTR36_006748 [Oleoguttula mirabilis]|uniref:Uncharacterized protein n=1 Tax=Oleoguttula mirabilis TaxID=1507867 RepID=A0AAV9JBL2_9PEZI|nr:hypothetical protein LTR36_006748 [Oleoguttula mirabilis]